MVFESVYSETENSLQLKSEVTEKLDREQVTTATFLQEVYRNCESESEP